MARRFRPETMKILSRHFACFAGYFSQELFMARATPGDDEKKTQTEVCATFSQELFMARATPGDDEKKTQTEVYATFSEELFMERRFHPEMMKNKYGFTD